MYIPSTEAALETSKVAWYCFSHLCAIILLIDLLECHTTYAPTYVHRCCCLSLIYMYVSL